MFKQAFATIIVMLGSSAAMAAETCALPQVADTAKLTPVAGSDLMTVPVEINGKPKQFLLDIGTGPTQVSQATVTELGLPENTKLASTIQLGGTGGMANMGAQQSLNLQAPVYETKGSRGREDLRERVRIATFTLGAATARNMQFLVADGSEIEKSAPYDGLITNDFFRQYDAELDFAGKQINYLTPAKCTEPDKWCSGRITRSAVIPITLVDGKIQCPCPSKVIHRRRARHQFAARASCAATSPS